MANRCVRDRILQIIDDIELTSKELFEHVLTPRSQRTKEQNASYDALAALLVAKEAELQQLMETAKAQEGLQKAIDNLKSEVDKQDEEIHSLQRHLKEAEHILATAIFQAKQKLALIHKANDHPLNSEDLIKYAHNISSSHAVSAPYNWEPGDPRRPYPTDLQMRASLLQSLSTADSTAIHLTSQLVQALTPNSQTQSGSYSWSGNQDMRPNVSSLGGGSGSGAAGSSGTGNAGRSPIYKRDNFEDVEMMSSESSSSSSSDSQ